jgi:EpsI family protein
MIETWSTHAVYSYAFAVPFIAAYIFWTRLRESRMPLLAPDYGLGVPVVLAGVAMLVIGRLAAIVNVEQASLVVTLAGLLLLLFGRDAVKWHWFAVAYLLLMVPFWNVPITLLQDPSRILSAKIAVNLLRSVGIPAFRQETTILLPSHALAVLRECSGVNQLIALAAMVMPAAYLWLGTNARRAALLLFAIAVSYIGNGFRIALTGWLLVNGHGDGNINGPSHLLEGLGVSVLGYLAIGACFSALSTSKRPSLPRHDDAAGRLPVAAISPLVRRRVWLDVAVLFVLLAASTSLLWAMPLDVQLRNDLNSMENRIDDWTAEISAKAPAAGFPGIDDDLVDVGAYPSPTGEHRFTAADDELVRAYRSSSGSRVQLYIGYYHRQEQEKELTGDASTALAAVASTLILSTESGPLELKEVVKEKAGTRRGMLFWYDVNGRIVSDVYRLKSYTIWDAVTRRRTNGAVVMIAWDSPAGAQSEAVRQHAIRFAQALIPVLRQHLPS